MSFKDSRVVFILKVLERSHTCAILIDPEFLTFPNETRCLKNLLSIQRIVVLALKTKWSFLDKGDTIELIPQLKVS